MLNLKKTYCLRFRDSYLRIRRWCLRCNDFNSYVCSVPQGSDLDPLLFQLSGSADCHAFQKALDVLWDWCGVWVIWVGIWASVTSSALVNRVTYDYCMVASVDMTLLQHVIHLLTVTTYMQVSARWPHTPLLMDWTSAHVCTRWKGIVNFNRTENCVCQRA